LSLGVGIIVGGCNTYSSSTCMYVHAFYVQYVNRAHIGVSTV